MGWLNRQELNSPCTTRLARSFISGQSQQTAGEQLIAIETSQWPSGKYYYQVAGAQGILFSSLMVQH